MTEARDTAGNHTDIHVFNRFFTYQVPHDARPASNVVATRFVPAKAHWRVRDKQGRTQTHQPSGGANDLVLRLRAALNSAQMDDSDQGMRVSVIQEDGNRVIVDGSTEDADERNVHLDSVDLSSSHSYVIKYEFFAKSAVKGTAGAKSMSGSHMGAVACSKPFVVQELVIASKELLLQRAKAHRAADQGERDISELPK